MAILVTRGGCVRRASNEGDRPRDKRGDQTPSEFMVTIVGDTTEVGGVELRPASRGVRSGRRGGGVDGVVDALTQLPEWPCPVSPVPPFPFSGSCCSAAPRPARSTPCSASR